MWEKVKRRENKNCSASVTLIYPTVNNIYDSNDLNRIHILFFNSVDS